MKRIQKNEKNNISKKRKNSSIINSKDTEKYDIFQLQTLLEDLMKKDSEYDLIIKGLKEKINITKHENNNLEKEIEQLKSENNDINKTNKKLNFEYNIKKKEIKNEIDFNNNMTKLKKNNISDKYKEELDKNKDLKNKISHVQEEINVYKNRLIELESILNYTNPEIQNETEEMKKFLSEL